MPTFVELVFQLACGSSDADVAKHNQMAVISYAWLFLRLQFHLG